LTTSSNFKTNIVQTRNPYVTIVSRNKIRILISKKTRSSLKITNTHWKTKLNLKIAILKIIRHLI